jgi:hypothetical protein
VSPNFSHDRIAEGETPTRRATSPIFKQDCGLADFIFGSGILHAIERWSEKTIFSLTV